MPDQAQAIDICCIRLLLHSQTQHALHAGCLAFKVFTGKHFLPEAYLDNTPLETMGIFRRLPRGHKLKLLKTVQQTDSGLVVCSA